MSATIALVLSGFLAAVLLTPDEPVVAVVGSIGVVDTGDVVLTGAVVVAGLVAAVARRAPLLGALGIGAALTAGVAVLVASPRTADPIGTIAGGVLLGAAAVLAGSSTGRRTRLAAATVGGLFVGGLVEVLEPGRREIPRRYAEYLVASGQPTPVVVPVLAGLTALAWTWVALRSQLPTPPDRPPARALGRAVTPILAGTAVLATSSTAAGVAIDVRGDRPWTIGGIVVVLAVIVLGAVLGRRWPRPSVGIAVLVLVCLSSLIHRAPWDNVWLFASLLVLPAVSAFLFASIARRGGPTGWALGLAVPVAISVSAVRDVGWAAYTPLDAPTTSLLRDVVLPLGIVVGTVVLAGIGIALLGRRAP
ncbi:hypothetical protein [Rhodococcoides corynebacterioides]|uniref:Type VII secretion integral membrane protein EccD n=1 Tax=Rhodococcoides corynebacterioides TaxID=53972 RepID=A0ABS7NZ66_9NOCA|nr:hypothetical protein [Rhodococcus corynebacterioides]MBY6365432.1 hypothetical protein [Rhodococcus corynebacterioides]MBY6407914.1 hypothetical protein [Rhodococcus corynebacterioides]